VEGAKPGASLQPFFEELYDSCNVKRPDWMNDWTWPPMRYWWAAGLSTTTDRTGLSQQTVRRWLPAGGRRIRTLGPGV